MIEIAGILTISVLVLVFIIIKFNRDVKESMKPPPPIERTQEKLIEESARKMQQQMADVAKDVGRLMEILIAMEQKKGRGLTQSEFTKIAPKPIRDELTKRGFMYRHDNHYLVRRGLFSQWEK
jgi:hypothetical protein